MINFFPQIPYFHKKIKSSFYLIQSSFGFSLSFFYFANLRKNGRCQLMTLLSEYAEKGVSVTPSFIHLVKMHSINHLFIMYSKNGVTVMSHFQTFWHNLLLLKTILK